MTTSRFLTIGAAICLLAGCNTSTPVTSETKSSAAETAATAPKPEPILPAETPIERTANFVSPKTQKTYQIEVVKDDREEVMRALPSGQRDVTSAAGAVAGDNFRGTSRKAVKLSIANAPLESFGDVKDLIATLPAHAAMVNRSPRIPTTAASNRVAEEKRNIKLTTFLYAASREDDNDFHLIVGRARGASPAVYMTVELGGLPPANSPAFAKLKSARTAFKSYFGSDLPGSSYTFFNPPIPLEIEGSLFFDMSHATGSRPGPSALRPKMPVVWEIHPISKMVFEP